LYEALKHDHIYATKTIIQKLELFRDDISMVIMTPAA